MTFTMVFTQHLPTLALVSLGAGETALGLQSAMGATDLLRLPTLRAVGRFSKRSILIFGQLAALLGALPILFFPFLADLSGREPALAVTIAVSSLIAATASLRRRLPPLTRPLRLIPDMNSPVSIRGLSSDMI